MFGGIPLLSDFLSQLMSELLPVASQIYLIIDRAHSISKPSFLLDNIPHDVLALIHFYRTKEKVMAATINNPKQEFFRDQALH